MNEFDKIKQLSEGLLNKKEPTFTRQLSENVEPVYQEAMIDETDSLETEKIADSYGFSNLFTSKKMGQYASDRGAFRSKLLIFTGLFVVIGAIAGAVLIFNKPQEKIEEVVRITADVAVVKEKPVQVGGQDIPDQDKMVYQRIRTQNLQTKVESLFPEPEKPVVPTILEAKPLEVVEVIKNIPAEEIAQPPVAPQVTAPKKEVIALKQVKTPVSKKGAQNQYAAQVFSSNNKEKVAKLKESLLKKYSAILKNEKAIIVEAKIPDKGVFYRLRFGDFASRKEAAALCDKLKAHKQDCIPVK